MLHAVQRYGARWVAVPLAAAILCAAPAGAQEKAAAPAKPRQLSLQNKPWTGDFDQMLERRVIRVLAPYSRTLYYVDKAHERGHHRGAGARVRALRQPAPREAAGQATADGVPDPDHARAAAPRAGGGTGRHRGRQSHRDRGAAEARRFRGAGRPQAGARADRHGAGVAAACDARRSLRQDRARAQGEQLLRERGGPECPPGEGAQGTGQGGRAAGRARG